METSNNYVATVKFLLGVPFQAESKPVEPGPGNAG